MIEKYLPVSVGSLVAILIWWNIANISLSHAAGDDFWGNLFGPVFDFATFFAASLFSIYVLALSRMDGFLGRIFSTKTFRGFHSYVSVAIGLSVLVSVWSAWYGIFGVSSLAQATAQIAFCLWAGVSAWAVMAVARVVLVFLVLVGADRPRTHQLRPEEAG